MVPIAGLAAAAALAQPPAPPAPAERFALARRTLERWTSPTLTPFGSEEEIRRWLADAREADQARPPSGSDDEQQILIVEGRVWPHFAAPGEARTAGVDDGDRVRQVGRFLLVLHNGRIYSIDAGGRPGRPLVLADRADPEGPAYTLYDELLVSGDRIVVTGYSNTARAAYVSVLRLGRDGRLASEGGFLVSTNDDYQTAIVGDALVIYGSTDFPYWSGSNPDFAWPVVRRWNQAAADRPAPPALDDTGAEASDDGPAEIARGAGPARPLLEPNRVYRPVATTLNGELHIVSVCPLGGDAVRAGLPCRSTGFAGPIRARFGLSDADAFVQVAQTGEDSRLLDRACPPGPGEAEGAPLTILFRVPLAGGPPGVLGLAGEPLAFGALPARGGGVHLLLERAAPRCGAPALRAAHARAPLAAFSPALRLADAGAYRPAPDVAGDEVAFTDSHLVLFHRDDSGRDEAELGLIPLDGAGQAIALTVPQGVLRAEPAAGGLLLTGLDGDNRVSLSFVALGDRPRIASTRAFGARAGSDAPGIGAAADPGASGLIGLPVTEGEGESWDGLRIDRPDIHFLSIDPAGRLRPRGALRAGPRSPRPGMEGFCDPPCVPWAGESRALFTNGRIFALAGSELVEGRIENGRIVELQRLDIAIEPARR